MKRNKVAALSRVMGKGSVFGLIAMFIITSPSFNLDAHAQSTANIQGKCTQNTINTFFSKQTFDITAIDVEVDFVTYSYKLPAAPVETVTEDELNAAVESALIASGKSGGFALYYPGTLVGGSDAEGPTIYFQYKYDRNYFQDFEITLRGDTDNHIETFPCDPLGISIDKDDADNTDDTQNTTIGGDAKFTITVTNIGDIDLTGVVVSDPLAPSCDKQIGILKAGADITYTCDDVNIAADYVNTASVEGKSAVSADIVTDTDTTKVVTVASCGDKNIDAGEQCDDGNKVSGDGCSASCAIEQVCGNSKIESGETCDDGNTTSGDSCSATCQIEAVQVAACGNSKIESGETCDDGNTTSGDGCNSSCVIEVATTPLSTPQSVPVASSPTCEKYSDIKGYVYEDTNQNGEKDSGEEGIEDVTVALEDEDGEQLEEDETNSKGKFKFENYAPGDYILDLEMGDSDLKKYVLVTEPGNNLNGKDGFNLKCDNDHTGTGFGFDDADKEPTGSSSVPTLAKTGGDQASWYDFILVFFKR